MKYKIFTDVSCDIDLSVVPEGSVSFIPMEYSLGDEMLVCSKPENRDQLKLFYDGQRNGDFTKTSQISPYMYEEHLTPVFEEGYSVLYISLSSGLSSTFNSSNMAKEELKEKFPDQDLYCVDSLAATGGMDAIVERAVRNQEKGMTIEENYNDLLDAVKHIRLWFLVQDLMYLKRGGRISSTTAIIGTALNITPILKVNEEGKLVTFQKKRGTKAAMNYLISLFEENFDGNLEDAVYVIDADAKELSDGLAGELKAKYPGIKVRQVGLSPIIGAHTGPGMAAICHFGK